jgi:hypothetical protein
VRAAHAADYNVDARLGFTPVAFTTPYVWTPPANR